MRLAKSLKSLPIIFYGRCIHCLKKLCEQILLDLINILFFIHMITHQKVNYILMQLHP